MILAALLSVPLVMCMLAVCEAQPIPEDERCTGFDCTAAFHGEYISIAYDPSECDSATCTQKCLVEPEIQQKLRDHGMGQASRTRPIYLNEFDFLAGQFPSMIFKILAMEGMGYTTVSRAMRHGRTVVCCPETAIWMEKWPNDPFPDDAEFGSILSSPVGYDGFSGIAVPLRTISKFPLATAYNAYKYLAEYRSIFPTAFSTPCNETLRNTSEPCTAHNRWCAISQSVDHLVHEFYYYPLWLDLYII